MNKAGIRASTGHAPVRNSRAQELSRKPGSYISDFAGAADDVEGPMTLLKWALLFFVVSVIAGILGFTGISAASADIARILFYIFVVIFLVLLILGLTIFRA